MGTSTQCSLSVVVVHSMDMVSLRVRHCMLCCMQFSELQRSPGHEDIK
jgi:hypothetical protein